MSEGAIIRAKFRPARALEAAVKPEAPASPGRHSRTRSERLARQLALAHLIERAVEDGRAGSYGEVARAIGLTESRITQITALLGLSSAWQERILAGERSIGIRAAIEAAREATWVKQMPISPGSSLHKCDRASVPSPNRLKQSATHLSEL